MARKMAMGFTIGLTGPHMKALRLTIKSMDLEFISGQTVGFSLVSGSTARLEALESTTGPMDADMKAFLPEICDKDMEF